MNKIDIFALKARRFHIHAELRAAMFAQRICSAKSFFRDNKFSIFLLAIAITLLCFSWIVFFSKWVVLASAAGKYIYQALSLYHNLEFPLYERGPIYPFLISIIFYFNGVSFFSAYLSTQITLILLLSSTYYLATKYHNTVVAGIALILFVLSPIIYELTAHVGSRFLLPSLVLLYFTLIYSAMLSKKKYVYALAGVALGLSWLTKETTLLYLPYPILLFIFIRDFRRLKTIKGLILTAIGAFLTILPFLIYLTEQGVNLSYIFGQVTGGHLETHYGTSSIFPLLKNVFHLYVTSFYKLSDGHIVYPLIVPSLILVTYHAVRRRETGDIALLLAYACNLPLILLWAPMPWGMRHTVLMLVVSCVVIARAIYLFAQYSMSFVKDTAKSSRLDTTVLLASAIVGAFMIINMNVIGRFNEDILKQYSRYAEKKMEVKNVLSREFAEGRFGPRTRDIANFINSNVPKGSTVLVGGKYDHAIIFYTNMNYDMWPNSLNVPRYWNIVQLQDSRNQEIINNLGSLVSVKQYKINSGAISDRRNIFFLFERDIVPFFETLAESDKYIVYFDSQNVQYDFIKRIYLKYGSLLYNQNGIHMFYLPKGSLLLGKNELTANNRPEIFDEGTARAFERFKDVDPRQYKIVMDLIKKYSVRQN